ncbi:MAG: hypothetical protein JWP55_4896 [Mycobacterium sp.]|jgi:hypothetical protein|nr:hypothetical protein [Mycobacterium sp.]
MMFDLPPSWFAMWAIQRIPLFDPVRPTLTLVEFG